MHHAQGIRLNETTDSLVSGNTADHNSCIGIRLTSSDYNTISNNVSFGNSSAIAWPEVLVSDVAGIELTRSSHNTVIHNISYGNEDTGINMYVNGGVGSNYNVVVGNLSYGNGDHGIDNNGSTNQTIVGNTVQGNYTSGINLEEVLLAQPSPITSWSIMGLIPRLAENRTTCTWTPSS